MATFTVTLGNSKVGVGVMVGVGVIVGVSVKVGVGVELRVNVGVNVYVDVKVSVGMGVFVEINPVAVWTVTARPGCTIVGKLQAERSIKTRMTRKEVCFIVFQVRENKLIGLASAANGWVGFPGDGIRQILEPRVMIIKRICRSRPDPERFANL